LKPEVAGAIEEIRATFDGCRIEVREDGEGGAFVIAEPLDPGPSYAQRETWVGFHITFQYPYSDVYPHFVRGDLSRADGAPLGAGTSITSFEGRQAVQLSRRSNHIDPAVDTAALKLWKVVDWLQRR
jgi:hypothetical protein